jgi:hypothetical protein
MNSSRPHVMAESERGEGAVTGRVRADSALILGEVVMAGGNVTPTVKLTARAMSTSNMNSHPLQRELDQKWRKRDGDSDRDCFCTIGWPGQEETMTCSSRLEDRRACIRTLVVLERTYESEICLSQSALWGKLIDLFA